ncbi:DUF2637 domain-containing protein [Microbacterium esteraromaticum]|uniref:DUF2637 domain-containing protein n=2 Tax=Microbacterium TaxID=33882 RepID=UPI0028F72DBF|nr:DUF2637 domain-containing protein [Microbacterium esteraromaticum]
MSGPGQRRVGAWVVGASIVGTVLLGVGAFWLSFTALADLASRAGTAVGLAWVWPLIVDGVIVIATMSVVALSPYGRAATRYPWLLLSGAALVSITANITHALVAADDTVPGIVAALVASVPPIVLLAATHLTVELGRYRRAVPTVREDADVAPATTLVQEGRSERTPVRALTSGTMSTAVTAEDTRAASSTPIRAPTDTGGTEEAIRLSKQGLSNRQIAIELGVHPTTIGRWLKSVGKRSETIVEKEES